MKLRFDDKKHILYMENFFILWYNVNLLKFILKESVKWEKY